MRRFVIAILTVTVAACASSPRPERDELVRYDGRVYVTEVEDLPGLPRYVLEPWNTADQLHGYEYWSAIEPDPQLRPQLDLSTGAIRWVTVCNRQHPYFSRCADRMYLPRWLLEPGDADEVAEATAYFRERRETFSRMFPPTLAAFDRAKRRWLDACDPDHPEYEKTCHVLVQRRINEAVGKCRDALLQAEQQRRLERKRNPVQAAVDDATVIAVGSIAALFGMKILSWEGPPCCLGPAELVALRWLKFCNSPPIQYMHEATPMGDDKETCRFALHQLERIGVPRSFDYMRILMRNLIEDRRCGHEETEALLRWQKKLDAAAEQRASSRSRRARR